LSSFRIKPSAILNREQTLGRNINPISSEPLKNNVKNEVATYHLWMEKPPHSIPEELLKEMEVANHRFSEAKRHLEEAMDSDAFRHEERLEEKREEFRAAERGMEETTRKIGEALRGGE
jgi:hypothetical protein